jgi:hypothetical protein
VQASSQTKKRKKQAQRNKISLFDMILDLSVIKLLCMSLPSLRRFKGHGWHFLFFDASIVVEHYIDTLSSPQPLATFIPHALAKVELSCTIKRGQRQIRLLLIWGAQISFKKHCDGSLKVGHSFQKKKKKLGASLELINKKYEYTPMKKSREIQL